MKSYLFSICFLLTSNVGVFASDIIPIGDDNNTLYYKIGGGNDFSLPPVSDTTTLHLDSNVDLGLGNSCSTFNPALSITNSMNDIKDSADNLEQSLVVNATGSLIQAPMYFLAQANPTAYNFLNNALLSAHKKLEVSTKSCEMVKSQIANGKNPYQEWGTLAINDQWKKHLTLISSGNEDINYSKKEIDSHAGDSGVAWVQGDTNLHAGGKGQPAIHVVSDTVKAGYNAMLNRNLQSNESAPASAANDELRHYFPNPGTATSWITSVVGDQIITTCNDASCKKAQGSFIGHGLLPLLTSCQSNKENCIDTIRDDLSKLVTGNEVITKENLTKVSAEGIAISPAVVESIRNMDTTQQAIIVDKLAQDVAVQRVIDKAFIAKNILSTGAQVPVIAANHPAQVIIGQAITNLDNEIRSLVFENQIKKQTMSDTISEILSYSNKQQNLIRAGSGSSSVSFMENGAMHKE